MRLAHDRGEDLVHNYGQIQARVLINSLYKIDFGKFLISENYFFTKKNENMEISF